MTKHNRPEIDPTVSAEDMGGLYQQLHASLTRFAYRYLKKPHEIEDVVQEAFVRVIEVQKRSDISYPKSYLYQAIKNLALKQLDKSEYRLTDTVGDLPPEAVLVETASLEEELESRQRFELFCRAVRQLPLKCQRVFILRRVYGFSQKEIAEKMDISIKTVEAHLSKAIVRCTDYMDRDAESDAESKETEQRESGHTHIRYPG